MAAKYSQITLKLIDVLSGEPKRVCTILNEMSEFNQNTVKSSLNRLVRVGKVNLKAKHYCINEIDMEDLGTYQARIISLLESNKLTVPEIAELGKMDRKIVWRTVYTLRKLGVNIVRDDGKYFIGE